MLNKIIKWSLGNRLIIIALALIIMIFGTYVVLNLPVDVFPDLNRPTVTIMSEAGGLAPEEVENLVTFPVETLMNGIPGVERIRSQSGVGLSIIWVEFKWGTDIMTDRQMIAEKLNVAKEQLPDNVTPIMAPISSIMGEIMLVSVSSKTGATKPMDLRTLAEWVIRPRIMTIPGIAQVINIGGEMKQYQVLVSPEKLKQFNVTLDEIIQATKESNISTTGGFIDSKSQEYLVRNLGRINSLDELKDTVVVYRNGSAVTLADVTEVKFGARIKRGDGGTNANPSVIMAISKQPGASTLELTRQIDHAIEELQKSVNSDIVINPNLFRQANFIETSIANVIEALRDGTIMVVIVLFLFLLNFRITAIILTAIPLSFIITFLIFRYFDLSINTMTLGGLAVAIGELVDDSIVDIENIFRRLKENKLLEKPRSSLQVIFEASVEVRSSIVYATFIVVVVFFPLFFLAGVEGRLLMPLGLAYILSLLASLLVSLTVTPVLASFLLPNAKFMNHEKEGFMVRFLKKWDEKMLHWTLKHPIKVIAVASIMFLMALATLPFIGTEFLPPFNEGTLTVNLLAQPGTSLSESNKIGQIAEKLILEVPEVISTGRRTGRAELDEHAEGVHYSEVDVDLKKSARRREEILNDIRSKLKLIPGVTVNVGQPISHRIDHLMSGIRAQIAIKLFGDDLGMLRAKAEEIRGVISSIEGATDVQVEKQVLIPQIKFSINRTEAKRYGLRPGNIAEILESSLNGQVVSEVIEGQKRFDLIVRLEDKYRDNLDSIKSITINTPSGVQIPVSFIADITEEPGPNQVLRENTKRRIVVMANTSGRDLGSIVEEIQKKVGSNVKLPEGYFIEYAGQFEAQKDATRRLLILSLFSVLIIFFLLIKALGDWRMALQVMVNVPLALIGAVLALILTGGVFSVATLVGFISLIGITSRNGIMMLSHYLHLMREENEEFSEEMIIRGSLERLIPVMMTALTAGLSLIPLAIAAGEPGKEILQPLAIVVLGGILTSTILDQVVTPAIFFKFGKPVADRIIKERKEASEMANKSEEINFR